MFLQIYFIKNATCQDVELAKNIGAKSNIFVEHIKSTTETRNFSMYKYVQLPNTINNILIAWTSKETETFSQFEGDLRDFFIYLEPLFKITKTGFIVDFNYSGISGTSDILQKIPNKFDRILCDLIRNLFLRNCIEYRERSREHLIRGLPQMLEL